MRCILTFCLGCGSSSRCLQCNLECLQLGMVDSDEEDFMALIKAVSESTQVKDLDLGSRYPDSMAVLEQLLSALEQNANLTGKVSTSPARHGQPESCKGSSVRILLFARSQLLWSRTVALRRGATRILWPHLLDSVNSMALYTCDHCGASRPPLMAPPEILFPTLRAVLLQPVSRGVDNLNSRNNLPVLPTAFTY